MAFSRKKSSLGRRSSSLSCNDTLMGPRTEKRSFLMQPGFTQTKRRASSENRLSSLKVPPPSNLLSSGTKSQCDLSLLDYLPPCTPKYFQKNGVLPSGSARPSRSRNSSMDSNRFSSVGSIKCSKKEIRPVNDKSFQAKSLRKVQDFFLNVPNSLVILDNSQSIKPMTLKKFINMADYLFKCLDEKAVITKENYIEKLVKYCQDLNYGGKIDRSWLVVVNAQHAWCHVIAFLVWLVDLVNLQNQVKNDPDLLYPEVFEDVPDEELLEANIRLIQPQLTEQFQAWINNKCSNTNFERADEIFYEQMLQKYEVLEENFEALVQEEMHVKATIENPEYKNEEIKIQQQEAELSELKVAHAQIADNIEKTKIYIESIKEELNRLEKEIELLVHKKKDKTEERNKLVKVADEWRLKVADVDEDNKQRLEFQRTIQLNEKSIAELSKTIFELDISTAKLFNQFEAPLIEYNKLITILAKTDPRFKSCSVDGMQLFEKPDIVEAVAEADKTLKALHSDWKKNLSDVKLQLQDLESKHNALKETEKQITNELEKEMELMEIISKEEADLLKQKERDLKAPQDSIKDYELKIKEVKKKIDSTNELVIVSSDKIGPKKTHFEAQVKEIIDMMEISEKFFIHGKQTRESLDAEISEKIEKVLKTASEKLESPESPNLNIEDFY